MAINWDTIYKSGRDYRVMNHLLLSRILASGVNATGDVLDVGCGTGDMAVKLALRGYDVVGVDLSKVALKKAEARAELAEVSDHTTFWILDIDDPNQRQKLGEDRYDLIICKLTLAYLQDKIAFFDWVKEHLAEGGRFVLITPVLHPGNEYSEDMRSIAMDYEVLLATLRLTFLDVDEIHEDYFNHWGDERTFVIR